MTSRTRLATRLAAPASGPDANSSGYRAFRFVEHCHGVGGHRPGVVPDAGVERRLSTAGLVCWELDRLAICLEQRDCRPADLGSEPVDQARDEQLNHHAGQTTGQPWQTPQRWIPSQRSGRR